MSTELTDDFDERYPEEVPGLFEGDIVLDGSNPFSRNAVGRLNRRWPSGRIPFVIADEFDAYEKGLILRAMKTIEESTEVDGKKCIQFINATDEPTRLTFTDEQGCHSSIGYIGKNQNISLSYGCRIRGIVMHEILHAVGFYHEQNRPDRDDYIKIDMSNVKKGRESDFEKLFPPIISTQNLPYDYNSIMHYKRHTFAKDRMRPTIIPLKKGVQIGQRVGMSQLDIVQLQRLYGCKERQLVNISTSNAISPNCTFDGGYCGWTEINEPPVKQRNTWMRWSGETESMNTGPTNDHTIGTFQGHYIYLEASRNFNSMARLQTPKLTPGSHCLTFWYHMYGGDMGTLNIYLVEGTKSLRIKTISGDQGNQWRQAKIAIEAKQKTKIKFEGIIGRDYRSDIALDDVAVLDGKCLSENIH